MAFASDPAHLVPFGTGAGLVQILETRARCSHAAHANREVYTLNPTPYTLHPKPYTLTSANLKGIPLTLTLNPQP